MNTPNQKRSRQTSGRPPRAAAYVRLSSWRGDDDPSTSPERQREACRAYCDARGWALDDALIFEDLNVSGGESGKRLDRPALKKARQQFAYVDKLVFLKIDRLARSVSDFSQLAEEAEAAGVDLVSVEDNLDLGTDVGKMVARLLSVFAQFELDQIRSRTRAGKARAKELGRWQGGWLPYGTKTEGGKLVRNDEEAAILRGAAELLQAGRSIAAASRMLERELPQRKGSTGFGVRGVRRILTSSTLVDVGVFTRAEHRWLKKRLEPTRSTGNRLEHLLSGILHCSCGAPMYGSANAGRGQYRCRDGISEHNRCPVGGTAIAAHLVEPYVIDAWMRDNEDHEETYTAPLNDFLLDEIAKLEHERDDLRARLAGLPVEEMPAAAERIRSVEGELEKLGQSPSAGLTVLRSTGRMMVDVWGEASIAERREMMRAWKPAITVLPGRGRGVRVPVEERVRL